MRQLAVPKCSCGSRTAAPTIEPARQQNLTYRTPRRTTGAAETGRFCSLIPGLGVKLSTIILAGPTVLSAVGACPPHDGVRRRWWINVESAVALRTLAKNRTISPPPPSRQGRLFPPCRGNPMISLCVLRGSLVHRPVELGSVDPHAVQNDRELPRDGDLGLAEAVSLGELGSPSLQSRPLGHASQQNAGRFEQIHAQHGVTALRDSAGPIDLPGGMASGRQSDIGANTSRSLEARRIVDRRLEAQCGDRADTRYGHEPADLHIMTRQPRRHSSRYSITLSERARSVAGTVRPSALAQLYWDLANTTYSSSNSSG
jgi:hypothetical protein